MPNVLQSSPEIACAEAADLVRRSAPYCYRFQMLRNIPANGLKHPRINLLYTPYRPSEFWGK